VGIVHAVHFHGPQNLDPGRLRVDNQHRMLSVFRPIRIGTGCHHDVNGASGITCARRPPFLAIENKVIAIMLAAHFNISRIRRSDIRFRHEIGRADFPL